MCGLLLKPLYGTRDAAQNWGQAYTEFMLSAGFTKGKWSPCCFVHSGREIRAVVHGDDFTVLGHRGQLQWFRERIRERFEVKFRGMIGPGAKEGKQMIILNRMVTWTNEGSEYKADQRHAEIIVEEMHLGKQSKSAVTPGEKDKLENRDPEPLDPRGASKYRAMSARINYLAQDRTDLANTAKELSKEMANPTTSSMHKLKRTARYLIGAPRFKLMYPYQSDPKKIKVWTDTDFAGCLKTRKSTSAGLIRWGSHLIKSWSTNQAVTALSSGEAEYYSLVKGASNALGTRSLLEDLLVSPEEPIEIKSDASAAIGIANRVGAGKVRHIEVNQLWLQEKVFKGEIVITKVKGEQNLADASTKMVDAKTLSDHIQGIGPVVSNDRHPLAPESEYKNVGNQEWEETEEGDQEDESM